MKSKLLLYSVSFLILGFSIGFSVDLLGGKRFFHRTFFSPEKDFNRFIDRFSKSYNLTDTQKEQISKLFENQKEELNGLREDMIPKFEAIRLKTHDQIKSILNEEQKLKFQKKHDEHLERRKRDKRDGHRPPPPHHHRHGGGPPF